MTHSAEPLFQKHLKSLLGVALVAMVLCVFIQTYHHEFINFDDSTYITNNPNIKNGITIDSITWAFTTGHEANWHPLTWLSHMLDYELYGMAPAGHHLTNVFLHAVNSLLLFFVLTKLTGATYRSFLVAALFAVHPLHVESVAWAAERKDLLCAFFWFITMLFYAIYSEAPGFYRYCTVIVAFSLGLLSKSMIVSLPLVLMVIDYWPSGRVPDPAAWPESLQYDKTGWRSFYVLEKVPLLCLAAVSSLITFHMQEKSGSVTPFDLHNFLLNIGNAAISYVTYITQMLWPTRLAVFYPFVEESITVTKVACSAILICSITITATVYRKRFPYLISGWLWYLVTLLPVIGIIRIGRHALADRYTYIPLVGLFVIVVWGFSDLFRTTGFRTRHSIIPVVAVIAALMFTAFKQVGYWQDSYTLSRHAAEVTVKNSITLNNLGEALLGKGKYDEAYPYIVESIRIKPDYEAAYSNLGIILFNKGDFAAAQEAFQTSIRLRPPNIYARYNLAAMYSNSGKLDLALQEYMELAKTAPALAAQLRKYLDKQAAEQLRR